MSAFKDPETYRDILDGLQIGVSVLDLRQKIIFWNDGAERITGYSRIDVLGHTCVDSILLHCNLKSCEMCVEKCPINAALHEGRPFQVNGFLHHRAGHRESVHLWAIPLRDRRGSLVGVIQTFEGEFAVAGADPNDASMRAVGCIDERTGLPNQAMMQSHLREALGTFAELHIPFGVVLLEAPDLGKFRARYTQEAGTSMMRVLAQTLRNTVWPTDFVGRWEDEQFLVILAGCDRGALTTVAERIVRMMASATIEWWGQELSLAVWTGLAVAQDGDDVASVMQRAHQALGEKQELPLSNASSGAI